MSEVIDMKALVFRKILLSEKFFGTSGMYCKIYMFNKDERVATECNEVKLCEVASRAGK